MTAETVAEGELSRARRDLRLAVNDLKAMRSTMRAAGLSAEEDTLQGMMDAYGDARVALDRALRATPPDGPVGKEMWVTREDIPGKRNPAVLHVSEPEKRIPAKAKEIWWANTGRTVVLDDDLGLAPGACQRFRLVPVGETK